MGKRFRYVLKGGRAFANSVLALFLLCSLLGQCLMEHPAYAGEAESYKKKNVTIGMVVWRGATESERGFLDGLDRSRRNIEILRYDARQSGEAALEIADRLLERKVDLIYTFGTTVTQIVMTKTATVPVVFSSVNRPVMSGIIESWERSANNAVGASNQVPIPHQLKALRKVSDFKRLGIIFNPLEKNSLIQLQIVAGLASEMGFTLSQYPVSTRFDVGIVLPTLRNAVDAVYIPADSLTQSLGKEIMALVNGYKIPSLAAVQTMVSEHGALLGLVNNLYQLGRLAAEKANLILSGTNPTDIPSSNLGRLQLWVNMHTAQEIGVQVPVSVLVMANRIVR